jgi:hypothetical protein
MSIILTNIQQIKDSKGNPILIRQAPITLKVNQRYKTKKERLFHLQLIRDALHQMLKDGYSPVPAARLSRKHTRHYGHGRALRKGTVGGTSVKKSQRFGFLAKEPAGALAKLTNGSNAPITKGMIGGGVLDRGFTGHEHLFGTGPGAHACPSAAVRRRERAFGSLP